VSTEQLTLERQKGLPIVTSRTPIFSAARSAAKGAISTLMAQGSKAPFTYTGT
jgi:hypothetical protein